MVPSRFLREESLGTEYITNIRELTILDPETRLVPRVQTQAFVIIPT